MTLITETDALARFCAEAAGHPYVTVDTEFLRERTYYAQLCLVQLARPGQGEEGAVLVDTLSDRLSLDPLYELFRNRQVTKVFHAARQDLEIFQTTAGVIRSRSSIPRSRRWSAATATRSATRRWSGASPAPRSTSRRASPTGAAGRSARRR